MTQSVFALNIATAIKNSITTQAKANALFGKDITVLSQLDYERFGDYELPYVHVFCMTSEKTHKQEVFYPVIEVLVDRERVAGVSKESIVDTIPTEQKIIDLDEFVDVMLTEMSADLTAGLVIDGVMETGFSTEEIKIVRPLSDNESDLLSSIRLVIKQKLC